MDSALGRFQAPDPVGPVDSKTGKINDKVLKEPQRINAYAYGLNNPGHYVDRDGLWGEDVHSGVGNSQYGTYTWSRQLGFTDRAATKIATANDGTDGGFASWMPIFGLQSRHFNQGSCAGYSDSRAYWADGELNRAVEAYNKGRWDEALGHIGKGLHSIQDMFAHRDWDTGLLGVNRHPQWYDDWNESRNSQARAFTF
jgi:hypothetical protein